MENDKCIDLSKTEENSANKDPEFSTLLASKTLLPEHPYYPDADDSNSNFTNENEIIMHMDIRESLQTLQKLLEKKLKMNLENYHFWLQDTQELELHGNLVDQCVKGEGLVQINVEINYTAKRINILDVLKPTQNALEALAKKDYYKSDGSVDDNISENTDEDFSDKSSKSEQVKSSLNGKRKKKPSLNWILDAHFRREQARHQIPRDPAEWTVEQVQHWLHWAAREFKLSKVNSLDWLLNGNQLCHLTHEEFCKKIEKDPGNIFWTHLQLLKECKFVAVVHKALEGDCEKKQNQRSLKLPNESKIMRKFLGKTNFDRDFESMTPEIIQCTPGIYNMNTGNGQVQLWQFLLDILTDPEHVDIIKWVGQDGEFKLADPERVARLWGERKNKPAMNYEKLSRALRYYYDSDMISKVSGKRFTYKFDCDLRLLIGYSAAEIAALVNQDYTSENS